MKNLRLSPIGGCSAVAFACVQKHLSGSRSHRENAFALRSNGSFATLFVLFCSDRKGQLLYSKLFLFERKPKKKQNFRFAPGVHKPLTPGEVPSLRGGEGFALSVAFAPALPKGEPYMILTFGTNFGALIEK